MSAAIALVSFLLAFPVDTIKPDTRPRHPFAPSLPQLSDEEEEKLDQIIDRFILYDIGQLKGQEGKQALLDFQRLGPEATFALIRGLNRAAAINDSCPAVVISKKLRSILGTPWTNSSSTSPARTSAPALARPGTSSSSRTCAPCASPRSASSSSANRPSRSSWTPTRPAR